MPWPSVPYLPVLMILASQFLFHYNNCNPGAVAMFHTAIVVALVIAFDQPINRVDMAETLVAQMAEGQFDKAVEPFDQTMKRALPAEKLKEVWDGLTKQYGPLQRASETRTEKDRTVRCRLRDLRVPARKLDTKVVFDGNKVPGFSSFRPGQYRPPSYADSVKVRGKADPDRQRLWRLPGTLSLPKGAGPFPAVILVHGSGPERPG